MGERGEFRFLFIRAGLEAGERLVALLQRGLALGGDGGELFAVGLLDFGDLRGGGLFFFQLGELGLRGVARLHGGRIFGAGGGDFLFVGVAERGDFRLRLFLLGGDRGLLLAGHGGGDLLLPVPLLPAGLQIIALLERRLSLVLQHLDAFRGFRAELRELFARRLHLRLQAVHVQRRGGELRGQLLVFAPRRVAILQHFFQMLAGRRTDFLVLAVPVAVAVFHRRFLALDEPDFRAAAEAHADGVARDQGGRAFDQLLAEKRAVRAAEVAHREPVGGDAELRVFARDAVAVQEDVAGQVPPNDILARIEDVAPEGAVALFDNDFSLSGHKFSPCSFWLD